MTFKGFFSGNFNKFFAMVGDSLLGKGQISNANLISTANAHGGKATVLDQKGSHDEALDAYDRCLSIKQHVLGKGHPSTGKTHNDISNQA